LIQALQRRDGVVDSVPFGIQLAQDFIDVHGQGRFMVKGGSWSRAVHGQKRFSLHAEMRLPMSEACPPAYTLSLQQGSRP
jgi:hypothetical protein